ncbi:MAG TPA: uracil-DNA glycosylase [Blastocatellia bacterium]|nr:uracil-DNA glycosylase [Blastocatellia bacterium]
MRSKAESVASLQDQIINCRLCPRLVEWRENVAHEKVRRFADQEYWGRPVPSFGDPKAHLLVIGLAPAAHGGNRTGRIFTGDRSGDWLFRALHKARFANQPASVNREDGLRLRDCYVTAAVRCAPPQNKPMPAEVANCRPYLLRELELLTRVRVIVALGRLAFDAATASVGLAAGCKTRPQFGHAAECELSGGLTLIASFHPSQQNTFTGRLTEPMFDRVFSRAREIVEQNKPQMNTDKHR